MKRRIEKIFGVGAAVFLAIQFIPMKIDNPAITRDIAAPPKVEAVLRRACYNCHSNETHWPWYAHLAPGSWLVVHDVQGGRKHINFSTWDKYADDPETLITKYRNLRRFTDNEAMPLWYYLLVHPEGRLSYADREILENWASQAIAETRHHEESRP